LGVVHPLAIIILTSLDLKPIIESKASTNLGNRPWCGLFLETNFASGPSWNLIITFWTTPKIRPPYDPVPKLEKITSSIFG
jgi:hypothetical protein